MQTAQIMRDRISCYSDKITEIHDTLLYEENINEFERANALIAIAAQVAYLQMRNEKLEKKLEELINSVSKPSPLTSQ